MGCVRAPTAADAPTTCSARARARNLRHRCRLAARHARAESRPVVARGAAGVDGAKGVSYAAQDVSYEAPIAFPPHERAVEIEIDLGLGGAEATVIGADLTHEYVATNADYRS